MKIVLISDFVNNRLKMKLEEIFKREVNIFLYNSDKVFEIEKYFDTTHIDLIISEGISSDICQKMCYLNYIPLVNINPDTDNNIKWHNNKFDQKVIIDKKLVGYKIKKEYFKNIAETVVIEKYDLDLISENILDFTKKLNLKIKERNYGDPTL